MSVSRDMQQSPFSPQSIGRLDPPIPIEDQGCVSIAPFAHDDAVSWYPANERIGFDRAEVINCLEQEDRRIRQHAQVVWRTWGWRSVHRLGGSDRISIHRIG